MWARALEEGGAGRAATARREPDRKDADGRRPELGTVVVGVVGPDPRRENDHVGGDACPARTSAAAWLDVSMAAAMPVDRRAEQGGEDRTRPGRAARARCLSWSVVPAAPCVNPTVWGRHAVVILPSLRRTPPRGNRAFTCRAYSEGDQLDGCEGARMGASHREGPGR